MGGAKRRGEDFNVEVHLLHVELRRSLLSNPQQLRSLHEIKGANLILRDKQACVTKRPSSAELRNRELHYADYNQNLFTTINGSLICIADVFLGLRDVLASPKSAYSPKNNFEAAINLSKVGSKER